MMAHEGAFKCFELRLMLSFILSALSMYGANDHAYVLWCVHVYQSIYREARSLAPDDAAKDKGSALMKKHPPKGLGGQFIMYGVNRDGVCTMNLHTERGTCDDILTHFDPRPKQNQFITDNKRCNRWQSQYRTFPWKTADLGSVQENDDTRWKFTFQYHTDGLNILLNDVYYGKYAWDSQDGGYNSVSYIQIEYLYDKHYRQGTPWNDPESSEPYRSATHGCKLLALMPPRTPLGAAAFQEP